MQDAPNTLKDRPVHYVIFYVKNLTNIEERKLTVCITARPVCFDQDSNQQSQRQNDGQKFNIYILASYLIPKIVIKYTLLKCPPIGKKKI